MFAYTYAQQTMHMHMNAASASVSFACVCVRVCEAVWGYSPPQSGAVPTFFYAMAKLSGNKFSAFPADKAPHFTTLLA